MTCRCYLTSWLASRTRRYKQQALATSAGGSAYNLNGELVKLAHGWQTTFGNGHPTEPVGDPAVVSKALISKWARFFAPCNGAPTEV